ncbi:MAG: hypothetical protein H6926_01180 [Chromatiales bacterium]|nr:hypothetical protein [Gammaproteobacteria bacterium]MCP5351793.1 hypothetical protein [Chromatiales bacterium]
MRLKIVLLALSASLALGACTNTKTQSPSGLPQLEPNAAYQAAIEDARIAEPGEISRSLTAIRPGDPDQFWSNDGVDDHILMVSFTNWTGYDQHAGKSMTIGNDVWLTVAPQVRNICQALPLSGGALSMRLRQLHGLAPEANRNRFVEMWVKPGDLFRPSPDPEINDHEANLDFPVSPRSSVSDAHRRWFETLKSIAYDKARLAWTRLGYSYDWGNPDNPVGLSEFVARAGATVSIHSVASVEEYCGKR